MHAAHEPSGIARRARAPRPGSRRRSWPRRVKARRARRACTSNPSGSNGLRGGLGDFRADRRPALVIEPRASVSRAQERRATGCRGTSRSPRRPRPASAPRTAARRGPLRGSSRRSPSSSRAPRDRAGVQGASEASGRSKPPPRRRAPGSYAGHSRTLTACVCRASASIPLRSMLDGLLAVPLPLLPLARRSARAQPGRGVPRGARGAGHTVHLLTFDTALSQERRRALRAELDARGSMALPPLPQAAVSSGHRRNDAFAGGSAAFADHATPSARCDPRPQPRSRGDGADRQAPHRLPADLRPPRADGGGVRGRRQLEGGGLPYRLTQWVQRVAIRRAEAMVMLTEAVRRKLFGAGAGSHRAR